MMERGGYRGRGGGSGRNWNNGGRRGGRGGGQSHQYYEGHNQQQRQQQQQQQQQQPVHSDRYSVERYTGDQRARSTHDRQGNFANHSAEDYNPQPYWREQTQRFQTQGRGRATETLDADDYGRNSGPRDDGGNVRNKRGGYSNRRNTGGGNGGSRGSDGYGSGSRGTGRSEAAASQSQLEFRLPPPPPRDNNLSGSSGSIDPVVRDVSSAANFLKSATKHIPVKRPDEGGKCFIKMARLRVNHFPVDFRHDTVIRHYDIDVKPVNGGLSKVSKSDLTMIRNKLCADNPDDFPLSMTAYDGEKNIFTAVPLPSGTFKVEFTEGEDVRHRNYVVTIKHVSDLKLCKLKDYLRGGLTSIPRDILQGMDVVMKENPTRKMIQVGRTFHPVESDPINDLGFGITASRGIQHSLKPTFQGLALCLDYSVLAFRKKMPVIDFLHENIPGFSLQHFKDFRRVVEKTLKNLKVNVMHRVTKQKYTIVGLTRENTRHVKFDVEDSNGTKMQLLLVDYFTTKYGRNIEYMDIPTLDFSKNNRKNYVPMEFCVLAEGQIYPKENLDHNVAHLLKNMSLADPKERERRICDMVQAEDGPCGGGIIENFGLEVNKNMTSVNGRVLGPPELKLAHPAGGIKKIVIKGEKCQWNMVGNAVVEGKAIQRWALLDFSASERSFFRLDQDSFVQNLMGKCEKLGIHMERILLRKPARMQVLSNVSTLRKLLEDTVDNCNELGRGRLQLLLCAMSDKHEGYKYIKWISETGIGVVTQCFLSKEANKARGLDQYLTNLALKINAKLGGSNVELIERLPLFRGEGHVMCIGADVNHPGSRNKGSPSIAAVVASVNWPAMTRYAARVRPQDHRKEEILHFGQMCLELVEIYERLAKVKPEKILIFRDGVSEGQFDMVLNKELTDLKIVFEAISYHPTITLIVAQKRHQTRFFQENLRDRGHTTNVPPGTVVDTIVVHPREFDFYLCSHYGSLGTSKPTHYHVLYDEHFFSSDQLQELIYSMCFTFARCTKPVSLVPPVYYADLVAYRGRAYHDAMTVGHSPSVSSSSSTSSCASFDEKFYKLHSDLDDVMYFV